MPGNNEDRRKPPLDGQVGSIATSTSPSAAQNIAPATAGYYVFESLNSDAHIIFGSSTTIANPTSTTNALRIPTGQKNEWYIEPNVSNYFKVVASAAGTLRWARA